MNVQADPEGGLRPSDGLVARIVCGVDGSAESFDAAAQAAGLLADGGRLTLLAVADLAKASQAGFEASKAARQMLFELDSALVEARRRAMVGETRLLRGRPDQTLISTLERENATLLALGAPGHRRLPGLAFSAVGSVLIRESPRSVLVARAQASSNIPSTRIVVGVDGSHESVFAKTVATELAERFASELTVVAALGGKQVDADLIRERHPDAALDSRSPVDCLVDASSDADLVVVGSRGLHGLAALGSVSERVAHRARSSVLVIRGGGPLRIPPDHEERAG